MTLRSSKLIKVVGLILGVLVVAGIAAAAWQNGSLNTVKESLQGWMNKEGGDKDEVAAGERISGAKLVANTTDTLEVPRDVARALGLQTAVVQAATATRPLELVGSLNLDPDRLQRARTYFPGEVIEVGALDEPASDSAAARTVTRQIRVGDQVIKGQLLAVIYNADLGSKKNDLIDALSQLRVDEEQYKRLERLAEKAGVSEAMLSQAQSNVEKDKNAVRKAENTLRTFRVPEEEIDAVREEAKRIFAPDGKRDASKKNWARVEVRARLDGMVLERNVTVGDLVDNSTDLFKISDLSRLIVWANAYEEDLPALYALTPAQRHWQVRLPADPSFRPVTGAIDYVGQIIDPNQHTAPVRGHVDNRAGRLRVGQFISATVELPPPPDLVVIPATALDEEGNESIVFVQPDPEKNHYSQRRVAVARRGQEIYLRCRLRPEDVRKGLKTLRPGERVVTAGVILLEAALEDALTATKQNKP